MWSRQKGKYQYDYTRIESYTYNPNGTVSTKIDRNGVTSRYTYDVHGRMLSQTAGNTTISYTYDNAGNQLTITDSTGTTARSYDELGRVILKSVPNIGVMAFEYDIAAGVPAAHVKEVTRDVKGNITEREYDKHNRLMKVVADSEIIEYQYYQDGKRKGVVYPGATEVYTYYQTGYLHTLENKTSGGAVIDSYSYTYDPAGNQLSKTEVKGNEPGKTTNYEYDNLNRLIKISEPSGRLTEYTFDKAGNRKTEKVVAGSDTTTTTYEYNSQNRLMSLFKESSDGVKDTAKYTYDHNGNMTYQAEETIKAATPGLKPSFGLIIIGQTDNEMSRRVAHYTYNVFNQLVTAKTGGTTAQYVYNGEGLRVQKTVNGETTLYLYEYDKVVLELDANGSVKARNIYGLNLLARQVDSEKYYYMYNGHADVTALITAAGAVAGTYYYDAFGNILEETGNVKNPIRYAGYQYDEETELYYLNARMYDPKIARFLQEDTYRGNRNDPLSLHLYAYCVNNPIRYYDPTGRAFTEWDKAHITNEDEIAVIHAAGAAWQKAFEASDQAGMAAAHQMAETVRNKYRSANETGDGTGNTVQKSTDDIPGHNNQGNGSPITNSTATGNPGTYYYSTIIYDGDLVTDSTLPQYLIESGFIPTEVRSEDIPLWLDYVAGFNYQYANSMTSGLPAALGADRWADSQSHAFQLGRQAGAAAAFSTSTYMAAAGMMATETGDDLVLSGVGAIPGVVVTAGGVVTVGYAGIVAKTASDYMAKATTQGSSNAAEQTWKRGDKLVDGMSLDTNKALEAAEDFLGEGYKDLGGGRYASADGLRVVRMGDSDLLGSHGGGPHMNFETLAPNPNKPGKMIVQNNIHIYLK